MRLARFAVAGLALGVAVGFVAALLRPRQRAELAPRPSQSLVETVGQPIGWGTRAPAPPAASIPLAAPVTSAAPAETSTQPGSVAR